MSILAFSEAPPIGILHAGVFGDSSRTGLKRLVSKNLVGGSQGHYGWPHPPEFRDIGGSFVLYGSETNNGVMGVGTVTTNGPGAYSDWTYSGSIVGKCTPLDLPTTGTHPESYGAEAYSKMMPTAPNFQALNAIYELREVPGQLRQKMVDGNLKNISNYWIALQFGWKPLLNDIRNSVLTQIGMQNRLNQLLRDNGKPVRRRIPLAAAETELGSSSGVAYGSFDPGDFVTYFYSSDPTHSTREYQLSRVWASAQFRYWLPEGPRNVEWTRNMKAAIFGLNPSPSVVYNAVPWTWLFDWFTNTGYVLDNLSSGVADRCAADWFYVMSETHRIRESILTWNGWNEQREPVSFTTTSTSRAYSKFRTRGDPFGLAFNQNDLSPMQLSILGALGMSRSRHAATM